MQITEEVNNTFKINNNTSTRNPLTAGADHFRFLHFY